MSAVAEPIPFRASDHVSPYPHLLIACTGSVATIKLPQILQALSRYHVTIRVLLTDHALEFLQGQSAEQPHHSTLLSITNVAAVHLDADEWHPRWTRGAPILHIELRRWADAMLIAPCSANTLAKMVAGFSDNLVLSVCRAWDTTGEIDGIGEVMARTRTRLGKKRVWVAPAMNTAMWAHPVRGKQLGVLEREWGEDVGGWVKVLRPVEKVLACGDVGGGAMMEWNDIVTEVVDGLGLETNDDGEGRDDRDDKINKQ